MSLAPSLCPFCDHEPHDSRFCWGWSDCDEEGCGPHECACSYPDPGNFIEVPERPRPLAHEGSPEGGRNG